jgi:hypothetical protein
MEVWQKQQDRSLPCGSIGVIDGPDRMNFAVFDVLPDCPYLIVVFWQVMLHSSNAHLRFFHVPVKTFALAAGVFPQACIL